MDNIYYEPIGPTSNLIIVKEIIKNSEGAILETNILNEKHKISRIANTYASSLDIFSDMETVSAPSGEYAEYNHDYLLQEAIVETYEKILNILNYNYSMHYEKE